MDRIEVS